jgi:hypothetical protein
MRSQINGKEHKKIIPPLGIYEHKFNTKSAHKLERIKEEIQPADHQVDMKYIE